MANCPSCNTEKNESEFYVQISRSTKRSSYCKECECKKRRSWRKNNSDKVRNSNYKNAYGINLENYNKMFADQAGCCAICKKHQNEFTKKLSVDHDHQTGNVRALLCNPCNTSLGNMNDDIELLKSAIDYLEKHQCQI
jgi:hypothetical protein